MFISRRYTAFANAATGYLSVAGATIYIDIRSGITSTRVVNNNISYGSLS